MSVENKYSYDLYISFAKADNTPLANSEIGWVDSFRKFLDVIIEQILGEKPVILAYGNNEKPVKSELIKTAVFISVLSPEYVKNASCLEEIEDFISNNQSGFSNHFFKVIKFPVLPTEVPDKILSLLSYNLYDVDPFSGDVKEFEEFFSSDAQRKFWLKLVDLAYDIATAIKNSKQLELLSSKSTKAKTVYLAEVGSDLQMHRDNIKRELIRHGFRVLPDRVLPASKTSLEVSIKKDLDECSLSIHLIGDYHGDLIPGTETSVLEFQNQLAAEHKNVWSNAISGSESFFNRLIWISPDAEFADDKQKIFLDNIRRDIESTEDSEIIQSPIEGFKTMVLQFLLGFEKNLISTKNKKANTGKVIYVIYDKIDEYEAKQMSDFLKYQNFDVICPRFDGNLMELRENHLENLKICDFGLIYLNSVNDLWVQMKYLDLLKAPGLGRTKSEINKAMIIGKNAKSRLNSIQKFEVSVFQHNDAEQNDILNFLKN